MPAYDADRGLLFGLLALHNDFISREQLIAMFSLWLANRSQQLDEILLDQQTLGRNEVELLQILVAAHLKRHGDDPKVSLASLTSLAAVTEELRSLANPPSETTLSIESRHALDRPLLRPLTAPSGSGSARFHILRPHAKGGLGEVFVARDLEINREVALKEIQFHHADNRDSRARFVLEAEITGGLEHPGIVPVYGLGQYADGRPYYAMRFIRGESLREAVDRFHGGRRSGPVNDAPRTGRAAYDSLDFRKLLDRFIDVCNAVEYAHVRGVLHRDLKPSNIMLGKYGETLVVDWGLAKVVDDAAAPSSSDESLLRPSSGSGSTLTMMGQALGTPVYMSPEQAAGRLNELGPASDIYSLGATLYYILTGRPPIVGKSLGEVMKRAQAGDIDAPCALNRDIPKPLDAICRHAMALQPNDRYPSPQALADDVERYLADENVAAYTEPVITRAQRWMRKHPKSVAALAAALLVGLSSSLVIAAVVSGKNAELAAANDKLRKANTAERRATRQAEIRRQEAVVARTEANRRKLEAESNATVAREQSQLALRSLQSVIFDIQRKLMNAPGAGELRRSLLQTALARLQEVSDQFASRGAIDRNTMTALIELGDVFLRVGSGIPMGADAESPLVAAKKVYLRAFDIAKQRAAANPRDAVSQRDLYVSYIKLGDVLLQSGQTAAALDSYLKGLELTQSVAAADPNDEVALADMSDSYNKLGDLQLQSKQLDEARGAFQKGLEIRKKLALSDPQNAEAQRDLSLSYERLGDVLFRSGQVAEALEQYQKKLEILQTLVAAEPGDIRAARDLSISYERLGDVQLQMGQVPEALARYRQALEISHKATAVDPSDIQGQRDLSISHERLGDLLRRSGQFTEALQQYQLALAISQRLAVADPSNVRALRDLIVSYKNLGLLQAEYGQATMALESGQKSLEVCLKLTLIDPDNVDAQLDLFKTYQRVGQVQRSLKQYEQAIETYGRGLNVLQMLQEHGRLPPANADWMRNAEQAMEECRQLREGSVK